MKLKLIKDCEVVIDELEYEQLRNAVDIYAKIANSIKNQTTIYEVFNYRDMYEVVMTGGNGYITIKRFNSDDQDYNRICAEELHELLTQEQ